MKQSNNIKTPLIFNIAVILLCGVLILSFSTSNIYAKYTSTITAHDSARVAKFSFEDDFESVSTEFVSIQSMKPGDKESFTIKVENKGEVTISYYVRIENLTKNLPICKDQELYKSVELHPNTTQNLEFDVEWNSNDSSVEYMGKSDLLQITVVAEQVD